MLPNKKVLQFFFLDFGLFWQFATKITAKKTVTKKNWQNPNRLMKFSEIWYIDAFQQKKCYKIIFLDFGLFWPFYNQKTAKKKIKLLKSKLFDEIY